MIDPVIEVRRREFVKRVHAFVEGILANEFHSEGILRCEQVERISDLPAGRIGVEQIAWSD